MTSGVRFVALCIGATGLFLAKGSLRMDATSERDEQSVYTTSKQVQAWFLRRSRDLWKKKYAELKVESKRLRQRVADVCDSREGWRSEVQAARSEAQELRAPNALLQARLDARSGEDKKND